MRRWPALFVMSLLALQPVLATGQSGSSTEFADTLPVPAERGKPMLDLRLPEPLPRASPCLPALPCGTRLFGAVEKNGAIGVQVPALRW